MINKWTKEELVILTDSYPIKTNEELLGLLSKHNLGSIQRKAYKFNLKKGPLTFRCKVCGKNFTSKGSYAFYCSPKCEYKGGHKHRGKCIECGKEFYSRLKRQKLCSVLCSCRHSARKKIKRTEVRCLKCGKKFWKHNYRLNVKKHFCSVECKRNYNNKKIKKCEYCKKEFEYWPSRSGIKNKVRFCSVKCRGKGKYIKRKYLSGTPKSHDRRRAIEEYGDKCELCGWNEIVEAHHIDGNRINHNIENLCILCPNHHTLTEEKYKNNPNYINPEKLKELIKNERERKKTGK